LLPKRRRDTADTLLRCRFISNAAMAFTLGKKGTKRIPRDPRNQRMLIRTQGVVVVLPLTLAAASVFASAAILPAAFSAASQRGGSSSVIDLRSPANANTNEDIMK
jgi:hypothetical protein